MNVDRDETAFDDEVRRYVYDHVFQEELPPTIAQRGTCEILMANPVSAVPTPFLVRAGDRSWYGNCIWDAAGVPAMLGQDAAIEASCGCCGTAMHLKVVNGSLEDAPGVAHFAIPAAHWWDEIVFN